jgi:transcriptional regulator with XRE-family HTH domain
MNDRSLFAERLRQIRESKKLTQAELAEAIGTHTNVIWQYENGKRSPTLDYGFKIAKVLDVDLDYLIDNQSQNSVSHIDDAWVLTSKIRQLFLSSDLTQEQKDQFYQDITMYYWKSKK